jgi:hypothetical protein
MRVDPRDPDAALIPLFKNAAIPNPAKSAAEGRLICDDVEVVEIRRPGSRDWQPFPADQISHWENDPHSGIQRAITYRERFSKQYHQFKEKVAQTTSGTPLDALPFLTEARRAELRALNIYVAEQLAAVDGLELKNLGNGGRDLKNQAIEFIAEAKTKVPSLQMKAELEAMRARNQVLEEDNEVLRQKTAAEGQFEDMTTDQIRDYIKSHTGHEPQGLLNRKTLVRMAMDARPVNKVG